jgi:hypothetical protein
VELSDDDDNDGAEAAGVDVSQFDLGSPTVDESSPPPSQLSPEKSKCSPLLQAKRPTVQVRILQLFQTRLWIRIDFNPDPFPHRTSEDKHIL